MKGRKNINLNSTHIMSEIISFLPGACYSLNVMKTAKQFNKVQDFTALQVREGLKGKGKRKKLAIFNQWGRGRGVGFKFYLFVYQNIKKKKNSE